MAQQNIAAPTYPAQGNTSWKNTLEAILESFRLGINQTDVVGDPRPGKLNDRGAWAANTAYAVGDVVTRNARRYLAATAFTSGASFSAANWIDMGPLAITINGSGPSSAGDFTVAGGSSGIPTQGSRFLAGQAYSSSIDGNLPGNGTLPLNQLVLRRFVSGAAKPSGTNVVASWFQNAATASSFFRPVIYKINPADLSLTLVCDFGQVDCSTGAPAVKSTAATPTVTDIAVGDFLAVGGVSQGAANTLQVSGGSDGWLPSTAGPTTGARPQGLYLDGVSGAAPATIPALGASGGIVIKQSASSIIPVIYLTFAS